MSGGWPGHARCQSSIWPCSLSRVARSARLRGPSACTRSQNPFQNCPAATPVPGSASSSMNCARSSATHSSSRRDMSLRSACSAMFSPLARDPARGGAGMQLYTSAVKEGFYLKQRRQVIPQNHGSRPIRHAEAGPGSGARDREIGGLRPRRGNPAPCAPALRARRSPRGNVRGWVCRRPSSCAASTSPARPAAGCACGW